MRYFFCLVVLAGAAIAAPSQEAPPETEHKGFDYETSSRTDKGGDEKANADERTGLFEGDIMTDNSEGQEDMRNGILGNTYKWPNAVIPYFIFPDFSDDEVNEIYEAMKKIMAGSCITFRPYKSTDTNWISVKGDQSGCWSYVGRQGGGQTLNLGRGCRFSGTAAHEFIHAIGFYHQQSSPSRDEFVTINFENMNEDKRHNFDKHNANEATEYGVKYDFNSIMHYSSHAFSNNGLPTIVPKQSGVSMGQRAYVSPGDFAKIKAMYGC